MQHKEILKNQIKLVQLYQLKVKKSELAYQHFLNEEALAQNKFDDRNNRIQNLQETRTAIIKYSKEKNTINKPQLVKNTTNHCFWLDYDIEKDGYYLEMDREALAEAKSNSQEAKKSLNQLTTKLDSIQIQLNKLLNKEVILQEELSELDNENSRKTQIAYR